MSYGQTGWNDQKKTTHISEERKFIKINMIEGKPKKYNIMPLYQKEYKAKSFYFIMK